MLGRVEAEAFRMQDQQAQFVTNDESDAPNRLVPVTLQASRSDCINQSMIMIESQLLCHSDVKFYFSL